MRAGRQTNLLQESEPTATKRQGSHTLVPSPSASRATSKSPRGSSHSKSPRSSSRSSSKTSSSSKISNRSSNKKGVHLPAIGWKSQRKGKHEDFSKIPEELESDDESQEFIEYFESGDLDASVVQDLLATYDKYVNAKDEAFGWSPLVFAASFGCAHVLHVLLKASADLRAVCHEGNSALHVAARNGHCQAIECLLTRKANIDAQNGNGWTPLAWSSMNGYPETAARLLEAGAGADIADACGCTPSMWAARHGHSDIIEVLLSVGFDLHLRDRDGFTALDYAQEHVDVRRLLAAAADKNFSLLQAARRDDADGVNLAIQAGADVNARDVDSHTPLMWAITHESLAVVEALARNGAKCDSVLAGSPSPVSECLLRALDASDRLLLAARTDDVLAAREALSFGAWVNAKEPVTLKTPLMWASSHGSASMVQVVLLAQADLEQRDAFGWTALHFAVCSHNREVVLTLLDAGADLAATNYYDETALHLAAGSDDRSMVAALIDAGSDIEAQSTKGYTSLQLAALQGASDAVRELLAQLADASVQDTYGCSFLAMAVKHGRESVVAVALNSASPKHAQASSGCSRSSASRKCRALADAKASSRPNSSSSARSKEIASRPSLAPTRKQGEASPPIAEQETQQNGWTPVLTVQLPESTPSTPASSKKSPKKHRSSSASSMQSQTFSDSRPSTPACSTNSQSMKRQASGGSVGSCDSGFKNPGKHLAAMDRQRSSRAGSPENASRRVHSKSDSAEELPDKDSMCKSKKLGGRKHKTSGCAGEDSQVLHTPRKKRDSDNSESVCTPRKSKSKDAGIDRTPEKLKSSTSRLHAITANRAMSMQAKRPKVVKRSGKSSPAVPLASLLAFKDRDDKTALTHAVLLHQPDILDLLLRSKAGTDAIDKYGNTALIYAAHQSRTAEIEHLLAAKADVTLKNAFGQTAITIARTAAISERLRRHHIATKFSLHSQSCSSLPTVTQSSESCSKSYKVRFECLPDKLAADIVETNVRGFLQRCGIANTFSISVPVLPITMEPRGIAYVDLQSANEANHLLRRSGSTLCGSPVRISKNLHGEYQRPHAPPYVLGIYLCRSYIC